MSEMRHPRAIEYATSWYNRLIQSTVALREIADRSREQPRFAPWSAGSSEDLARDCRTLAALLGAAADELARCLPPTLPRAPAHTIKGGLRG